MIKEFINTNPTVSIIIISIIVTCISTLVTKWLTNQEHLKEMKKRQKELQKELKECTKKGDECRVKELQSEMLKITGTMMKSSFKPLFITIIPFLILIYWLRAIFSPVLSSWIWWYLGTSIISSLIFRKIFKMA
jgi:uncharacterized membrane protein (DUF106 family)